MKPTQLLAHFDRISDAPDAFPRLRRFILELAVRGKLVPQDSNETVGDSIPEIRPQFEGYDAPKNWRWTEFGVVAAISGGFAFKSGDYAPSGVFVLRVTNIEPSGLISKSDSVFLPKEKVSREIERFYLNAGDILLVMVGGSLGKIGVVTPDALPALLNQNLWRITPANEEVDRHFLKLLIDFIVSFQREITHSTHGHLSREDFRKKSIPLPPLAEQQRIVAKVDELMALCDRLEAVQGDRESQGNRLAAASLHRLNNGAGAEAFRDYARFYFNNLSRLTMRPDHIQQLRQATLNLAVRGKLVPQDSHDEPAAAQLVASDSMRQTMAKEDHRADADLQTLLAAEGRWDVPSTWEWRGLADLVLFIDYRGQTPIKVENGVRLITAKNVKKGFINLAPEEFLSEENYKKWMTRGFPKEGDVLFTTEAPMGNAAAVRLPERFALAQRVICFRNYGAVSQDFLVLQLLAEPFQAILDKTATGLTAKGIKAAKLKRLPVAVPPLAEQQRIVAKVDELLALCDRLEAQLTTTQTESRRLLEAVLHEALSAPCGLNQQVVQL